MQVLEMDARQLTGWLNSGKKVSVVDIRPVEDRSADLIPGSIHINVYEKIRVRSAALAGRCLDKAIPVVTFRGGGRTSLEAPEITRNKGSDVYSLSAWMAAWQQFKEVVI